MAAAPSGSLTIPSVGTITLEEGQFTFLFKNAPVGELHTIPAGSSWNLFMAEFTVASPGDYEVGVRNTRVGPDFINYDAFVVEAVPEPTLPQLSLALGVAAVLMTLRRRRRKWSFTS